MDLLNIPPPEMLHDPRFIETGVSVSILRLDRLHPYINGNKWFKLKYNLEEFHRQKKEFFVTFGGALSNHIVATAAAGKESGIKTIGIIRGNELNENSNPALEFASRCGMRLFFVSREEYRQMRESGLVVERIIAELQTTTSQLLVVPEGGSNSLAVKGCAEIVGRITGEFDFLCCACGTGTTLAGMSTALNANQKAIGISVLKGESFLEKDILHQNGAKKNFHLFHDYHFGGYAKRNSSLDAFCETFMKARNIPVEPVYTGRLFFGLFKLIESGFFYRGARITAVHSGGVFEWNAH